MRNSPLLLLLLLILLLLLLGCLALLLKFQTAKQPKVKTLLKKTNIPDSKAAKSEDPTEKKQKKQNRKTMWQWTWAPGVPFEILFFFVFFSTVANFPIP